MKNTLNLILSFLLLVVAAGCGDDASPSTGGSGGLGGLGGQGGLGGAGGLGGQGGQGGQGGEGGVGGTTAPKGNCHSSVPDLLSEWGLFEDIRNQVPADGVIPYEVTSPLYTDGALKRRFVTLRNGGTLSYSNDTTRWESPVGTIYVKTFAYPPNMQDPSTDRLEQLVETRLMVHAAAEDDRLGCGGQDSCWQVITYVYEDDMQDAVCQSGGAAVSIEYTDPLTAEQVMVPDYGVPSNGACRRCHGEETRTLGPSTGMLNRGNDYQGALVENQIDRFFELGMLSPEPIDPPEARVTYVDPVAHTDTCQTPECYHEAARSWFDANCSHCHAPDGEADGTGIFLDYASMDPDGATEEDFSKWGVCKVPTSAGGVKDCNGASVDITPGNPDASILLCRIDSVTPGEMMAPLGRSLVDDDGYEVVRQWILKLPELFPNISTCSDGGNTGMGGAGGMGGVGGAGI